MIILLIALFLSIGALTMKENELPPGKRGKVVSGGRSGLFDQNLNTASVFSFQNADSTGLVSGTVCVINNQDQSTGEFIEMVPRKFPKWFVFGCQNSGTIIRYKINGAGKAVIQFSKKQKKGPSKE